MARPVSSPPSLRFPGAAAIVKKEAPAPAGPTPMPIRITCPRCGVAYPVEDDLRGRTVRCRDCEEPVLVEGPFEAASEPTPGLDNSGAAGLSPTEAESLVRRIAERHGARGILRKL